jgi:hypothetical protein
MSRSTNCQADPEVWFRVVHLAQDGHNGATVAAYREQMVEIALGPKGAFENGNIGALTRWVPGDRTVNAVLQVRGNPKPPREPKTPRVVELLHKAIERQALLESGKIANQVDIARREGITRAPSIRYNPMCVSTPYVITILAPSYFPVEYCFKQISFPDPGYDHPSKILFLHIGFLESVESDNRFP